MSERPPYPPIKITFLGTGTSHGIPVISCTCPVCRSRNEKDKRLRCSILVDSPETCLVVDAGPDFREQMLRTKVDWLDALLITHEHRDHVGGLDDIRVFNYKRKGALPVYCYERVEKAIRKGWDYMFSEKSYPGLPSIEFHQIKDEAFQLGDMHIQPIPVKHYKLGVSGFRFGNFAYLTDLSEIPKESKALLQGLEHLVLGCLRREKHISHFNLSEALEQAAELAPSNCWLIHMSHDMGLHAEVEEELPPNVHLAYDGLTLNC